MISVEEAQQRIVRDTHPLTSEPIGLRLAHGRVLRQDVVAQINLPPFDNSAMDGYAIHADDVEEARCSHPIALRIDGVGAAGHSPGAALPPGRARKIMTGAPIPPGATAVVAVEEVEADDHSIRVRYPVAAGRYIRLKAQDAKRGEPLLSSGTVLTPGLVGVLASQGLVEIAVTRKPRVAILATGDELVEPGGTLRDGQIPNSNSYALQAAVLEAGASALTYPPVPDQFPAVRRALVQAAADADIVISSGGVSVGDYDFVKMALEQEGALDFWRVDMKPGKPVAFGHIGRTPFLGLPGNPVSSLVTFELFVRPLIRRLLGDDGWQRLTIPIPLATDFADVSDRRHYVRVALRPDPTGILEAWPTGRQDSHLQMSWASARGLMILPANQGPTPKGSRWPVMLI